MSEDAVATAGILTAINKSTVSLTTTHPPGITFTAFHRKANKKIDMATMRFPAAAVILLKGRAVHLFTSLV
jgi:hypothetical protein